MKDRRFVRMSAVMIVLVLISPFTYHMFYEHTRKDRIIDETNKAFKIAYFYPDSMLAYTEGGGDDGKDRIYVLDYEHINQDGINRLERQSESSTLDELKIDEYISRFEGKAGYDDVKSWINAIEKKETEFRTVQRNGRQMILAFSGSDKKAVLFNCKIEN